MKHAKHTKTSHVAAARSVDSLRAGEQAIYLDHMEKKPDRFLHEVSELRMRYSGILRFGRNDPATAKGVNFGNYSPEDLRSISFDNVTFVDARLPNLGYVNLLEAAGARLIGCRVEGRAETYTTPAKVVPRAGAVGTVSETVRTRQINAAWETHKGNGGR